MSTPVRHVLFCCTTFAIVIGCRTSGATLALQRAEAAAHDAVMSERRLRPESLPPRSVTVLPFTSASADTLGEYLRFALADFLLTDLSRARQLTVVDRRVMQAMLREVRLLAISEGAAPTIDRFGRLVGARTVVVGHLATADGARFRVDARLANAIDGTVRGGGGGVAPLAEIFEAEKALALQLIASLGVTLTPAELAALRQTPTRDIGALIAYGRGARAEVLGDFPAARAAYDDALRQDPEFLDARRRADEVPDAASTAVARDLATFGITPLNTPRDAEWRLRRPTPRGSGSRVEIHGRPTGSPRGTWSPYGPFGGLPGGGYGSSVDPTYLLTRQTILIILPITIR